MSLHSQSLGLHLRLNKSLMQIIEQVQKYKLKTFQFFLIASQSNKNIKISKQEQKAFALLRNKASVFIHSSYWINPATCRNISYEISQKLLLREISIAKKLEIPFIVLHPGSATWYKKRTDDPLCKQRGLQRVAKMLNTVLKKEHDITILLENTAHGNKSIGSDLTDFVKLKKYLDSPEKIGFCLDLAHAFVYGYDIKAIDSFMTTVEQTMGVTNIALIHFNDAAEKHGSKKDTHAIPGQGNIGISTLKKYLFNESLENIPKLIELPKLPCETIEKVINSIRQWKPDK